VGYAEYDVQGAVSGLLPVSYLEDPSYNYSRCIGLFASYDQDANRPIRGGPGRGANESLASGGYFVSGGGGPLCCCAGSAVSLQLPSGASV
jgi:hypothetical protein